MDCFASVMDACCFFCSTCHMHTRNNINHTLRKLFVHRGTFFFVVLWQHFRLPSHELQHSISSSALFYAHWEAILTVASYQPQCHHNKQTAGAANVDTPTHCSLSPEVPLSSHPFSSCHFILSHTRTHTPSALLHAQTAIARAASSLSQTWVLSESFVRLPSPS